MRYHPTHAAMRVRRSLSWQARSLIAATSVAALAGGGLALAAGAASAAPAGGGTVTYSDTGFVITGPRDTCGPTPPALTYSNVTLAGAITTDAPVAGDTLAIGEASTVPGLKVVSVNTGGGLTIGGTAGDSSTGGQVVVLETDAAGCAFANIISPVTENSGSGDLTATAAVAPDFVASVKANYVVGGIQFNGMPAATGAPVGNGFTFTDLPPGINVGVGELQVAGSTAHPGFYSSLGATYTDAAGARQVDSFGLTVKATKTVVQNDETGTIVDFSGKCVDVRNAFGHAAVGQRLQVWTCGVLGSEDQVFTLSRSNHTLTYGGLCVDQSGNNSPAVLETCNGSAAQDVAYSGGHYRFASGQVLDVSGFGKVNGTTVLIYAFNGGANQGFSRPA